MSPHEPARAASQLPSESESAEPHGYVRFSPMPGAFTLAAAGTAAPLVVSATDHPGVIRVVDDFRDDLMRVTGARPTVTTSPQPSGRCVLIGTIGNSPLVDALISSGKLDVTGIAGEWETSLQAVVDHPMDGIDQALVIAGSDQRGTIFGVYDVSRQLGVSPWYWWDDVPARQHDAVYIEPGRHSQGTPAVKYRGFFINDENPQTGTWAPGAFGNGKAPGYPGGLNHLYYEKVFEVMLRLKANYLWPAVWGRAFADDDPENHATAKRYGVVMGSSHEAPMMRGIEEWNRKPSAYGGTGEWSFVRNAEAVKAYWRDGIRRMRQQDFEGVVTLGMRGTGDISLPDGDGIDLMRQILATQREILAQEGGRPVTEIPQLWALYKEVQRYWDRGLRAPDDVTLLFSDDNWGNLRKLPDQSLPTRPGGYGMYFHFDYVGDGRNYKWVDTINLANTWEQLHTAYSYGVDRLWVVNVGDLKDMERPTQFFLDYAWNPLALPVEKIAEWELRYAEQNFGPELAPAIAEILHGYGCLQGRRKPELTNRRLTKKANGAITTDNANTPFSIENYAELDRVTEQWKALAQVAERIATRLPASYQDAYYQLVSYPVTATANLYALRKAQFLSLRYREQGRAATNDQAEAARARLADDAEMSRYYNTVLAGGKWRGWQTQTKFGYVGWQQPEVDRIYPPLGRLTVPPGSELGVAIAGSASWWPKETAPPVLPEFSPYQTQPAQYIEVFNRGDTAFDYTIDSPVDWLAVSATSGTVTKQVRATLTVDWSRAPLGTTEVPITVTGAGRSVTVRAVVTRPEAPPSPLIGFVAANGYLAMDADHYTTAVGGDGISWQRIPDLGRTGSGMRIDPPTAASRTPGGKSPRLEYRMNLTTAGPVTVWAYLSPRNNVLPGEGIRYAVSLDDQPPTIVNTTAGADDTAMNKAWEMNSSDNVNRTSTTFTVASPGVHTLKFWMVDPTVVLQRLIVDTGGLAFSYLGPPESFRAS